MLTPRTTSTSRAPVIATLLAAVALMVAMLPSPAHGSEHDRVTPARVAGEDRYTTAADIARLTFTRSDVAHVVSGEDFPDALAASYAAGRVDGPILLVERLDVPEATWTALEDLDVSTVVLVGGTAAVSEAVEAQLVAEGYQTDRIEGVNRYQTASSVAMRYGSGPDGQVGSVGGARTALVASGETFPDALAAGPVAASAHLPLFLTRHDRGDASMNQSLQQLDIEHVIIVGGPAAVSTNVEEQLRAQGHSVARLSGDTRMDTARTVADFARGQLTWSASLTLLARGDHFADALTGSIHGGTRNSPILLTESPTVLSPETRTWLRATCPEVEVIRALGGTSAVSQAVLADAVDNAEHCLDEGNDPSQDYLVAPQQVITGEPGFSQEFRISHRFGDEQFTGPVDVALFPCANVTATDSPVVFADADGQADGLATTDTGAAVIVSENDRPVNAKVVRDVGPAEDGILRVVVRSDSDDCAVPVVWDDVDGDDALGVDGEGHATEPFGVGQISWSS